MTLLLALITNPLVTTTSNMSKLFAWETLDLLHITTFTSTLRSKTNTKVVSFFFTSHEFAHAKRFFFFGNVQPKKLIQKTPKKICKRLVNKKVTHLRIYDLNTKIRSEHRIMIEQESWSRPRTRIMTKHENHDQASNNEKQYRARITQNRDQ